MQMENKILCATCGECCKNSGCEFSASDFSMVSFQELQKYLDQGLISIACDISFNRRQEMMATLYVKMRNVGHDAIDFLQITPAPCIALRNDGCPFDFNHRPSGGKYLIPKKNKECYYLKEVFPSWLPYQNLLRQLVIKYTGLTPEEKLRERIEDIFYNFFQLSALDKDFTHYEYFFEKNTDCFGDERCSFDKVLLLYFKEEIYRALERCKKEQKLCRTNPYIFF